MDYFILDGKSSSEMGIVLESVPGIDMPEERGTHYTVMGRAGDVFVPDGVDAYDPYIKSLRVFVQGADNVHAVQRWLRGQHNITFSTEPDRVQPCRILSGATFSKVSPYVDWYGGTINIKCQPYKYRAHAQTTELLPGARVVNLGDADELPVFHVTGRGTVSIAIDDGTPFTVDVPGVAVIDCEALITTADGEMLITSGNYPRIPTGYHTITFTDSFDVRMTRRERFV